MSDYNEEKLVQEIGTGLAEAFRGIPLGTTPTELDSRVSGLLDPSRTHNNLFANVVFFDIPLTSESNEYANSCSVILDIQFFKCYILDNKWHYGDVVVDEPYRIDSIKFDDEEGTTITYLDSENIISKAIRVCSNNLGDEMKVLLKPLFNEMLDKVEDFVFRFTMSLNSQVKDTAGESVTLSDILLDQEGTYKNILHVHIVENQLDEKQKIDLKEVMSRYTVDVEDSRRSMLMEKSIGMALVAIIDEEPVNKPV